MAVGIRNPVVGFDPDPDLPGSGMLQFEDGTELYGDDPQLAANLEATAPPDARTAGPSFAPEAAPVDQTQAGLDAYAQGFDDLEVKRQQEAEAAAQAEEQRKAQEKQRYLDTTVAVPYRPGVSQEQLAQQAESGTAIPVQESVQQQMGVEDTAEEQEARADAAIDQRLAMQKAQEVKVKQLENQVAATEIQGRQLQDELRDQRYVETFARKKTDNLMRISEQAAEAYRNHDVNPPKNSPMKDIGLAVMQAFGAYAAILGGGPNHAAQIIDNIVEREVAQRKLEHEQLGETADNEYSKYVAAVGDAELAEDIYRDTQKRFAMIQAERTAAEFGLDLSDAQFQSTLADYEMRRQEQEKEIREKAQGKIMRQVQSEVAYPRAASGGGRRAMTLEERAKASTYETTIAENRAKQETARRTVEAGGQTPGEISAEQKAQAKADERWVEGYGAAATREEAVKVRGAMAEGDEYEAGLNRLDEILAKDLTDLTVQDYQDARVISNKLLTLKAKAAQGGVGILTPTDLENQRPMIPVLSPGGVMTESLFGAQRKKLQSLRKESRSTRRALINNIVQGQHPELPKLAGEN